MAKQTETRRARVAISVTLLLVAFWVLLAGTDPASLVVAVPSVALAFTCVMAGRRGGAVRVRPVALARLAGTFALDSLRGALDVGRKSVALEPDLCPRVVRWQTSLRSSFAQLFFVHAVSLVPGTLSARIDGPDLLVHVLDARGPWQQGVEALETRIAAAFEPDAGEMP